MKRSLLCVVSVILLLALAAGCGALPEGGAPREPGETRQQTALPEPEEAADLPKGLILELERAVYDPSLTQYVYFVRNGTEETVEFGQHYAIQRKTEDGWQDLTMAENAAFWAVGYMLGAGKTMALSCSMDLYEEIPEAGEYRLIKTVGDYTLSAPFRLGDSPYTAETPYGLQPLERLPEDYGADTAADTDVVFTNDGGQNAEMAAEFLQKVFLGVPCQLRVVQDYGEGTVMVTDVVNEKNALLWRLRSGGTVTERRFSYIVSDGADLYLADGADWENTEKYNAQRLYLLPEGTAAPELLALAEEAASARLEGNVTRCRVWSADGRWSAALTEAPTEFSISYYARPEGGWGEMFDLQNWDGMETAIKTLAWQPDNTLLLTCETSAGTESELCFDPETKQLTNTDT